MGQVFYKIFYHVTWTTDLRQSLISPKVEEVLYPFLENKAKRFKSFILGIGGTDNHIHVAITIPPSESVSDIVGKLKGSSSYFLNQELQITKYFGWQDGFGVLSFAEKDLKQILNYINRQKEHHESGSLNSSFEKQSDEE
jgi:putative transposase